VAGDVLFEPLRFRNLTIKNRVGAGPLGGGWVVSMPVCGIRTTHPS
jgi:hypothetical protein